MAIITDDQSERLKRLSPAKRALLLKALNRQETTSARYGLITQEPHQGPIELSYAQQRLWFVNQLAPHSNSYNIPILVSLEGPLNSEVLSRAYSGVISRHETLRTRYVTEAGTPYQVIEPATEVSLPLVDLSHMDESRAREEADSVSRQEMGRPLDLEAGPVMRGKLIKVSEQEHELVIVLHHIAADGWSVGILLDDLCSLYEAAEAGVAARLPSVTVQYADYAIWQRRLLEEGLLDGELRYWKRQLEGVERMELPTDLPRPRVQRHVGGAESFTVGEEITGRVKRLCVAEGATLYMGLLAAYCVMLVRYSRGEEAVIGTPIANRGDEQRRAMVGMMVNTVVMRVKVREEGSYKEMLKEMKRVAASAYENQEVPFEKVVEELKMERGASENPVFQVGFVMQNQPRVKEEVKRLRVKGKEVKTGGAKFDISLTMKEEGDSLEGVIEYDADLFFPSTIQRMVESFQVLLNSSITNPDCKIKDLPIMSQNRYKQLLIEWNDTEEAYEQECIHTLFEAQVKRTPDHVALTFEGESITYRELNCRANQLARYLRQMKVGPEVQVGLYLERNIEMLVALLGVLKAGGAYVPLDPEYPPSRIAFILSNAAIPILLHQQTLDDLVVASSVRSVNIDALWEDVSRFDGEDFNSRATSRNLAYVIYTSGSTGVPKGVQIEHRGLCNLVNAQRNAFAIKSSDRILQFASLSFDASIFEILMAWATGATLHLARRLSSELSRLLLEEQITTVTLPPSVLSILPRQPFENLARIIVAGEPCHQSLVSDWARKRDFFNAYGPTEATVWASVSKCNRDEAKPTIGHPISNVKIYLLDSSLTPVPVRAIGELYISSPGLARGYVGLPELTAEKFIPDPFPAKQGERLYKSGDLARYQADGNIEFIGRADHQVKLRGHRIELAEIEFALRQHESIQDAVVVLQQDDAQERENNQRLIAYFVSGQKPSLSTSALRAFLDSKLPEFMIPSIFVELEFLPLTPNGKVDRNALPLADTFRPELGTAYEEARKPLEQIIIGIWCEILHLEKVGVQDNFFELGGHSLLALQVLSRLKQVFDLELSPRLLFDSPTPASLALNIEGLLSSAQGRTLPALTAIDHKGRIELSYAQQRLWFVNQLAPHSNSYNIPILVSLEGPLNSEALSRAYSGVISRHETLRTRYVTEAGTPYQVIEPATEVSLPMVDLSHLEESRAREEADSVSRQEMGRALDLEAGPVMRGKLIKVSEQEHELVIVLHHIAADGWSVGLMLQEIAVLYESISTGNPSPLPELPIQYTDFAVWQRQVLREEALEGQLAYWKKQLGGDLPKLDLPTDRRRQDALSIIGEQVSFALPADLSASLNLMARSEGCTLFMTLLAAFQALLHCHTRQEDIIVGTDIANRNHVELEGIIGMFVNMLAMRADLSGDPSFRELLRRARKTSLEAYLNQDLPFDKLVEELRPDRGSHITPIFQVALVLNNMPIQPIELSGGLTHIPLEIQNKTVKFDLVVNLWEVAEGITGHFQYRADLYDARMISQMTDDFRTVIAAVVEQPDVRLSALVEMIDETNRSYRALKQKEGKETRRSKLKRAQPKPISGSK